MISGQHTSRGTPWDGAKLTYVGTADITGGNGEQRGYFHNTHPDGAVSHGTFVAKVSAPAGEHLNTQLTNELTAVNQYFLHARTLQHWGVTKLGKQEYAESIGEMKHADELIKRILFLDGLPNVQRLNPIRVGESVEQILRADQALEEKALDDLREGIAYCESVRDFVSRDLLLGILESEEEHVDFLERQFDLIKQIGIERYVMLNAGAAPEQDL